MTVSDDLALHSASSFFPVTPSSAKRKHLAVRASRAEPVGARQVIPKVIETSDRQADNKPEWELHRETLVKQDEDAVVLA